MCGMPENTRKLSIGCPPGIRTPIDCSRGSCPTIEREGSILLTFPSYWEGLGAVNGWDFGVESESKR